jgi:hypothetical protein
MASAPTAWRAEVGALSGTASYLRFPVDGEPPRSAADVFEQAIEARRFAPLTASSGEQESAGWVPIEDPYDDELPITRDRFYIGDLVALAYREDKWSLPRPIVKQLTKRRIEELIEKGEKMPRTKRKQVELAVIAELRKKSLPRPRVMDVVWDTTQRQLRIFGRGPMATERCVALFERTFAVRVGSPHWASQAFALDLSMRARSVLEQLSPEHIFDDALAWRVEPPEEPEA